MKIKEPEQLEATTHTIKTPKGDHNHWAKETTYNNHSVAFNPYLGSDLTVHRAHKSGIIFKECPDLCWGYDMIHSVTVHPDYPAFFAGKTLVVDCFDDEEFALDIGDDQLFYIKHKDCI